MRYLLIPILFSLTACLKDETISGFSSPDTIWHLVELGEAPVATKATLRFPAPGDVRGRGPCNAFSARQTAPYPWISLEQMIITEVACPELALEGRYIRALTAAQIVEVSGDVLILSDESGVLASFKAR